MAKTKKRKHRKLERSLPVMRPNAGGIDIGATEIFVAVPGGSGYGRRYARFPSFTQDLHALADWLRQCRVDTVAMESTGVYWDSIVSDSGGAGDRGSSGQCSTRASRSRP